MKKGKLRLSHVTSPRYFSGFKQPGIIKEYDTCKFAVDIILKGVVCLENQKNSQLALPWYQVYRSQEQCTRLS